MGRTVTSTTTSFTSSFLGGSTSTSFPNPASDPNDVFFVFLAPPPDETPEQRVECERREVHARKVSDEIDEMLKAERAVMKKRMKAVKVLLLGQSESGAFNSMLLDE